MRFAMEQGNWLLQMEECGIQQQIPTWLKRWKGDGVISRSSGKGVEIFRELRLPYVELLGDGKKGRISDILTDSKGIAQMVSDHFLQRGFERFGFFSIGQTWWSDEFCRDFRQAVEEKGFPCFVTPLCSKKTNPTLPISFTDEIVDQVTAWIRSLPKPVGILCSNDSHALYLVNVCRLAEVSVPGELAVLGIDNNISLCSASSPKLSSVFVNGYEIGYRAAELLNRRMNGEKDPPLPILVPPLHVVTRQSTDLIAINNHDIAQAIQFIRDNATARISVEDVANHIDLSSRALTRKFRQYFNKTPEEYIFQVRMEEAKTLLLHTDLTVTEIAQNTGYLSSIYFARAFKRETGLSPKSYRLRFQSSGGPMNGGNSANLKK